MGGLTLILGGARSGKSSHAEKLAAQSGGSVLYVATAEALDPEMSDRIAAHRENRPQDWRTLEAPRNLAGRIKLELDGVQVILIDCLTLLANNLFVAGEGDEFYRKAEQVLLTEVGALIELADRSDREWIVVSNEVGLGLVPANPLGRAYRDALGRANQRMAAGADRVLLMVAGLAVEVKP